MNRTKQYYFFILLFILPIFLLQNTGCEKEYSFEGADATAIIIDTATIPLPPSPFPPGPPNISFAQCASCTSTDDLLLQTWNFKSGDIFLCGTVNISGFIGGDSKKDFTLFGPSKCSDDTGLVLSAFLPVPLDQDRFNIDADEASISYYNHNAPKDIFISSPEKSFRLKIKSFIYATGETIGTFGGTVFKADGDTTYINSGNFKVTIK